jgi:hypothetical protein
LVLDIWAIQPLWLIWVAPILGAVIAGMIYPLLAVNPSQKKG